MIAGTGAHICNVCVDLCVEQIAEIRTKKQEYQKPEAEAAEEIAAASDSAVESEHEVAPEMAPEIVPPAPPAPAAPDLLDEGIPEFLKRDRRRRAPASEVVR
jgi:hypothetical protein